MTDLQVKYQTLQLEKEKLAEDRRLHDAQIGKLGAETSKVSQETIKVGHELDFIDAQTARAAADAQLTLKDVQWYDTKTVNDIAVDYMNASANMLKGVGSLLPF